MSNYTGKYSVKDLLNRVLGGFLTGSESESLKTNIYSKHEAKAVSPGDATDGYNVKTTGAMFGIVTYAYHVEITNNDGSHDITVYLNEDNTNPITIPFGDTREFDKFEITNIFIDTLAGHSGSVEIVMFGE